MKKLFIITLLCLFLFGVFFEITNAYVSVKGYFRANGTYVSPHVRSSPNALKYDNYSWTSSQGLYNKTYSSSTKNYSSDWYVPAWTTDPDYYVGKSIYESGQGSGSYVIPKSTIPSPVPSYVPSSSGKVNGGTGGVSVPIVPVAPKAIITCGSNEYLATYNNTCYCNTGYKKNSAGICEQVVCGSNEYLATYNNTCYCNTGYKKNYSTNQCERIIVPSNAHLSEWSSRGWYCDTGYKQVNNVCQLK